MVLEIKNARIVSPGWEISRGAIRCAEGRIEEVGESSVLGDTIAEQEGRHQHVLGDDIAEHRTLAERESIDATGLTALPGFIDIHTHGRSGHDFCDATDAAFDAMGRDRLQDGVTGFLATTLTQPEATLAQVCRCAEAYKARGEGATCLGVHLEGPFFPAACAGAQNPAYLADPDIGLVDRLQAISPVKKVSFAPELPGAEAFTRALVARGIVASGGHSKADHACFQRVRAAGLTHLTHFCNVMTPIHHYTDFGMVGGGLMADEVYVEMICDGVHLLDPMIALIARVKGPEKMMLITDSMRAAGCPDGDYSIGGLPVKVVGGCARLANPDGTLGAVAGSTLRYYKGLQRLVRVTGWPLHEAVRATSLNQCVSLGIPDRGRIEKGCVADIVLVDDDLVPQMTIVSGEVKWKRSAA